MSEFYTIFVLTFQASMGFSVVKVIMGVFLQNTFSVAANDDVKLGSRDGFRAIVMLDFEHLSKCCGGFFFTKSRIRLKIIREKNV